MRGCEEWGRRWELELRGNAAYQAQHPKDLISRIRRLRLPCVLLHNCREIVIAEESSQLQTYCIHGAEGLLPWSFGYHVVSPLRYQNQRGQEQLLSNLDAGEGPSFVEQISEGRLVDKAVELLNVKSLTVSTGCNSTTSLFEKPAPGCISCRAFHVEVAHGRYLRWFIYLIDLVNTHGIDPKRAALSCRPEHLKRSCHN